MSRDMEHRGQNQMAHGRVGFLKQSSNLFLSLLAYFPITVNFEIIFSVFHDIFKIRSDFKL